MLEMFGYDKHWEELGRTNTLGKVSKSWKLGLAYCISLLQKKSELLLIAFEFEY